MSHTPLDSSLKASQDSSYEASDRAVPSKKVIDDTVVQHVHVGGELPSFPPRSALEEPADPLATRLGPSPNDRQ